MSIRNVPVAVGLSVILHVAAEEGDPIVSGGSIAEGVLLNKELYEAELGSNILIFKTYITIYQTYINCSYIYF